MSDRVALIAGSTVGRDHFPFPVPNGTKEGAFDIGTACYVFYVWRKLIARPDSGSTITLVPTDPATGLEITRESGLVAQPYGYWANADGSRYLKVEYFSDGTECLIQFHATFNAPEGLLTSNGDYEDAFSFLTPMGSPNRFWGIAPSGDETPGEAYWAYAATDDTPIYDTDSGVGLQDPMADYDGSSTVETITQKESGVPSTLVINRTPVAWQPPTCP